MSSDTLFVLFCEVSCEVPVPSVWVLKKAMVFVYSPCSVKRKTGQLRQSHSLHCTIAEASLDMTDDLSKIVFFE